MASSNAGKGAAEEPEPEPGPPPSSSSTSTTVGAAAASYDPRAFQPPHPDDRSDGSGGGGPTKATKGKGKGKAKAKAKGDASAKDKGGVNLDRCGNCDAEGALRACKQCGAKAYCGESCQRVSGVRVGLRPERSSCCVSGYSPPVLDLPHASLCLTRLSSFGAERP